MAHIGVLEEFEKAAIPVDLIVGCSAGSLVGALYAHYDRVLVDGGVINPIPVQIAKQHSVDVIVAVDISAYLPEVRPSNLFGVAKRCTEIQFLHQSNLCIRGAEYVIRPELGEVGTFDHTYNEEVYKAGCCAARAAIPEIRKILAEKSCHQ